MESRNIKKYNFSHFCFSSYFSFITISSPPSVHPLYRGIFPNYRYTADLQFHLLSTSSRTVSIGSGVRSYDVLLLVLSKTSIIAILVPHPEGDWCTWQLFLENHHKKGAFLPFPALFGRLHVPARWRCLLLDQWQVRWKCLLPCQ